MDYHLSGSSDHSSEYMSIPISQCAPPSSLFPWAARSLFFCKSVSVLDVHLYHSFISSFLDMFAYLFRLCQVLAVAQELVLQLVGSLVVAPEPAVSVVVACGLSCSTACEILAKRIELTSPALQGGFLSTGPPGKSLYHFFLDSIEVISYVICLCLIYFT